MRAGFELEELFQAQSRDDSVEDNDPILAVFRPRRSVAVVSGKGGVGKSTVAVNLAVAMAVLGKKAGIVDADPNGSGILRMLGLVGHPSMGDSTVPLRSHGIQVISIGNLLEEDGGGIWRTHFMEDNARRYLEAVAWGELDYLFVSLPPGIGEATVALLEAMADAEIVLVTTPQQAVVRVVSRAAALAGKTGKRILGVVENMAFYHCPHCGERSEIFGRGGAGNLARQLEVPLLGGIPLAGSVREGGDRGKPVALEGSQAGKAFREIALKIMAMEPGPIS